MGRQRLGKLKFSKNMNKCKPSPKIISWMKKKSYDFWNWKFTMNLRFRHFLTTRLKVSESQIQKKTFFDIQFLTKNLLPVDPCPQNFATEVTLTKLSAVRVERVVVTYVILTVTNPICHYNVLYYVFLCWVGRILYCINEA